MRDHREQTKRTGPPIPNSFLPPLTKTLILIPLFVVLTVLYRSTHSNSLCSTLFSLIDGYAKPLVQPGLSFDELRDILLSVPDGDKARAWTSYYAAGLHLAGTNRSQAEWTRDNWKEFGIPEVKIVSYDVLLNYPISQRLALLEKDRSETKVIFEASLIEDINATEGQGSTYPAFHGYSASGNVTARFLYANFGTQDDFDDLVKAGIDLKGMTALVKYGQVGRSLKIRAAQEMGLAAVIMYSDPQQDGEITEENGHKPFPDGFARHPTSIERGSIISHLSPPGDPTTPGYPSTAHCARRDPSLPTIPSIPISYADALPLLRVLNGHGPLASKLGPRWYGGGLGYKGIYYNIGPSPNYIFLNLDSRQRYVITPIWNVIGTVPGVIEDEVVVVGNHRDSWTPGAGDPNSGSAVMNEIIRSFGVALQRGWKPQRTIKFGSWDGQEYAFLGSTEWTEEHQAWLHDSAVAYLNVVVAASGKKFNVHASSLLRPAIVEATSRVLSPNQTIRGQTVLDEWGGNLLPGGGGDAIIFLNTIGVTSLDMGFSAGPTDPIYPYHSSYDNLVWMDKFGDPSWQYHVTVARIWGLMAGALCETAVLPFSVTAFASQLQNYLDSIKKTVRYADFDFQALTSALAELHTASVQFDANAACLEEAVTRGEATPPSWMPKGKSTLFEKVRTTNSRYKHFEKAFLHEKGLDDRTWSKHVVFAPSSYYLSAAPFPGLVESLAAGNTTNAQRWNRIIIGKVHGAIKLLQLEESEMC